MALGLAGSRAVRVVVKWHCGGCAFDSSEIWPDSAVNSGELGSQKPWEGQRDMAQRVLLIEDEPNIIEAISFILSRDGWTVHTHSDGETANDRIKATPPDLVILDVMLPGKSGYDILRDIRADSETSDLPVLMLTARGQARDRELAERLGANHFMVKPFSNDEVLQRVRDLVGKG